MKILQTAFVALSIIAVATTSASARTYQTKNLAGLTRFFLIIDGLNDNWKMCGVTKESLETSLRFILGQSKIKLVEDGGEQGVIALSVNVNRNCAINYDILVKTNVWILATKQIALGATIWNEGWVMSGGNAAVDFSGLIENAAKVLVNDWNSVNK